ncbi:MAG: hypothetical protein Q8R92_14590 [Deltaproteobacteria bacterium]|nr:hypothetical protein [Deltaproteobacteria bacterium]
MKRIAVIAAILAILAGCMTETARFKPVEVAAVGATKVDARAIGLLPLKDDRPNQKAGHIGGLRIKADDAALAHVGGTLAKMLVERGFRVVETTGDQSEPGPLQLPGGAIKTIAPVLQAMKISTADAILFTAVSDVDLAVTVYDVGGKAIYARKAHGENKGRLWVSMNYGKKSANAMSMAVDDALLQICEDPEFLAALQ